VDPLDPKKAAVATALREYMRQKGYDRYRFADKVNLSKSTIDKMLVGIYSDRALARVESNTGISFGPRTVAANRASETLGAYFRADVEHYIGDYLFARPSSSDPSHLQLHPFHIDWDTEQPGLAMRQGGAEKAQVGLLSIPRSSMHIFVTSNDGGWIKLMAISQLDAENKMFGLLLTAGSVLGGIYIPISLPVVLRKVANPDELAGAPRLVLPKEEEYAALLADLKRVTADGYARTVSFA
jgi:hypothetical protein